MTDFIICFNWQKWNFKSLQNLNKNEIILRKFDPLLEQNLTNLGLETDLHFWIIILKYM